MLRVYACIAYEHDIRLVLLAGIICFISAFTAFLTYDQARRSGGLRQKFWSAGAAFVAGIGIWSTHFIAMLAYQPNLPIGYDVGVTLLSVITAIVVGGVGWRVALATGWRGPVIGGALVGGSIGAMHYVGMAAVQLTGWIAWDQLMVVASVLLGVALSVAAHAEHRRSAQEIPWRPALLLTLAICSLHFTAMAAAIVYPDPNVGVSPEAIDVPTLTAIVTGMALLILAIAFSVVLFDRSLARRQVMEGQRLKTLADALQQQVTINGAALDNMAQGLSMYDAEDRLVIFNGRYVELYGLPESLLQPGTHISEILKHCVESGIFPDPLDYYVSQTADSSVRPGHTEIALGNGRIVDIQRRPMPNGGWIATHEDITEQKQSAERIAWLARHDDLTGLPNRLAFGEHLEQVAEKTARGSRFALLTVDLDRFKELNDTLGHPVGDDVLKQAAQRLLATVRDGDFVTRLGGDEFAIIQGRIDQPEDAAVLARRTIEALSEPFALDGHTVAIGASVGIALSPQDASAADDLLMKSDLALYRAKAESRGTFRFFEPGMDARLKERRELEADLRKAIEAGEFELHYQPIINLASGAVSTLEALLRWRHPERGIVMPAEFIPAAEESGLIIPIGEWVLRQACRDAASWPRDIRVAVNLSAAQFKRGDIVAMIGESLKAARIPAERLELEITESVLLRDEAWVLSVLQELRAMGVRIAMDDFGTGYSSLSYLRAFPFTKIKIDRGFVADLSTTASGRAIVEATIRLSRKLGLITTAEGVETAEQMGILIDEGCAEAQGFHISAAMPASEIKRFLAKLQAKAA